MAPHYNMCRLPTEYMLIVGSVGLSSVMSFVPCVFILRQRFDCLIFKIRFLSHLAFTTLTQGTHPWVVPRALIKAYNNVSQTLKQIIDLFRV